MALALAASMKGIKSPIGSPAKDVEPETEEAENTLNEKPTYPPLPEEPKGSKDRLCRVGVRLPDGRRVQRNFLRTDPIKVEQPFKSQGLFIDLHLLGNWAFMVNMYAASAVFLLLSTGGWGYTSVPLKTSNPWCIEEP